MVDNPLVPLADPVFLGFHALGEAQVSCKVVRKRDPDEKVGVIVCGANCDPATVV